MSLFGQLGTAQNKPSLFGQPAATTTQPAGSLFGSLNAPKTPSTTNLFGSSLQSAQPAQQQQQNGGLFGSSTAFSAAQSQPAHGTSLFGSTTQPLQPAQNFFGSTTQGQNTGGNMFGQSNLNGQAAQNQPSAFGASQLQPQESSQTAGHSKAYFDSLLEKNRKRAYGESALEELPSLQLGLGDLRQRLRKLGPDAQQDVPDGRAQYVLAGSGVEIGAAVRDLSYFDTQAGRIERARPAPSNDVESYIASLQTQTTRSMIEDSRARSARQFESFLEENVTIEWEAQRRRIYEHFGIKTREGTRDSGNGNNAVDESSQQGAFGRSRKSKGLASKASRGPGTPNGSTFGRSAMQRSVIGTPGPIGSRSQMSFADVEKKAETESTHQSSMNDTVRRDKQSKFGEKVQGLNAARIGGRPYPILREFLDVESQATEDYVEHVVKAYMAVLDITKEGSAAVKERQFCNAYLDENPNSESKLQTNKRILSGTSRHLEKQFFNELESLVAKNPREANLGGVPNVLSKVRAYIRVRASRKDLVPDDTNLQFLGDDYVWALVFFLLRAGQVEEAVRYVASNEIAFRAIDRNFITYITDYNRSPEHRLRRELQDRINNEYNQRVRIAPENSIDPFRMACYKVVGRCDMNKKALDGIYHEMPDWLWLQFILAREVNRMDEIASEVYALKDVQSTIESVVAKHSPGNMGFGVFFYLQVLCGKFEQAISFLYAHEYIDAVHFAIALDYYGLLRVSGPAAVESDLLTFSTRGLPEINFARMVGYYTQDFRAAKVVVAVDYIALLCLNCDLPGEAGSSQASQCHEALRELVLESRDFTQLLGDVFSNGERIKGAIEERLKLLSLGDTDEFMRTVTLQAAGIADDSGRISDAALLYHLSEEYGSVIGICNRALSESLSVQIGDEEMQLSANTAKEQASNGQPAAKENPQSLSLTACKTPMDLASTIMQMYQGKRIFLQKISEQDLSTLRVLMSIHQARVLVSQRRWPEALDILAPLSILPIRAAGDSSVIRASAAAYSSLPPPIARLVPNLILWSVVSASEQRKVMLAGTFGVNEGMRHVMIGEMKEVARDLMMYAGFLRYRLPSEVNELLARIAAE